MLLTLSYQFIHPNRIYLHEKRQEDQVALDMQILLRNELHRGQTVSELDIVGDVEVRIFTMLKCNIYEVCLSLMLQ